jgi:hypothetical protein
MFKIARHRTLDEFAERAERSNEEVMFAALLCRAGPGSWEGSVTEFSVFEYRVFLSYSHHDKAGPRGCKRRSNAYRIDPDLVGPTRRPAGLVPTTLRPIFRNREPLAADDSLTEQTLAALQASQFLAVICYAQRGEKPARRRGDPPFQGRSAAPTASSR